MEDNDEDGGLGAYIRKEREAVGMSASKLARGAGVDPSYITKLERGERDNPSPAVLQRLADALGINVYNLLARSGLRLSSALPPASVYLRKKYGLIGDEADAYAALIEHMSKKGKENGAHEDPHSKGGE